MAARPARRADEKTRATSLRMTPRSESACDAKADAADEGCGASKGWKSSAERPQVSAFAYNASADDLSYKRQKHGPTPENKGWGTRKSKRQNPHPWNFVNARKLLMPRTFAASELSREKGCGTQKRQMRRAGWKPARKTPAVRELAQAFYLCHGRRDASARRNGA